MNTEPENNLPSVEQINQNYLIDPENLQTNAEKTNNSFLEMSLPEAEQIASYDLNEDNFLEVSKTKTPENIFNIQNKTQEFKNSEEFKGLVSEINTSIKPSLNQMYNLVSQVINRTQDPKGFTDDRPTFNGVAFFFDEEKLRISDKPKWA